MLPKKGYKLTFDEDSVIIVSKATNDVVQTGRVVNGLYVIDLPALLGPPSNVGDEVMLASSSTQDMAQLWHERCGHMHEQKVVEADRRGLVKKVAKEKSKPMHLQCMCKDKAD
jgi:hypothetical protein